MSGKKSLLITYPAMMIGGSTTSLLSILNRLYYDKYEVDLLLNSHTGELLDMIPPQVNLLPPALRYTDRKKEYLRRLLNPYYMFHYIRSKAIAKKSGVPIHAAQYLEWKDAEFFRKIDKEYDVAVAFLEGDRCKFTARHVKAKRKVAWIHINYKDSRFNPEYDRDTMCAFDNIVLVSEDCKRDFDELFPELADRTLVIENILASEYVRQRAKEGTGIEVDGNTVNLVTHCRISFKHKGLDRAVSAMARLKSEGLLPDEGHPLHWYIIGDGGDRPELERLIAEAGLGAYITLLGMKKNPYPYLPKMTLYFQPSRWEGKPMAVTEAFMLGLPVLATEYSSAREQIRGGVDGIIVANSEEGIYEGLKRVILQPEIIPVLKDNVDATDYSNTEEIQAVQALFDGDGE